MSKDVFNITTDADGNPECSLCGITHVKGTPQCPAINTPNKIQQDRFAEYEARHAKADPELDIEARQPDGPRPHDLGEHLCPWCNEVHTLSKMPSCVTKTTSPKVEVDHVFENMWNGNYIDDHTAHKRSPAEELTALHNMINDKKDAPTHITDTTTIEEDMNIIFKRMNADPPVVIVGEPKTHLSSLMDRVRKNNERMYRTVGMAPGPASDMIDELFTDNHTMVNGIEQIANTLKENEPGAKDFALLMAKELLEKFK